MLQLAIKFAMSHALSIAGVWAVTHGLTTNTGWQTIAGFITACIAYIIHWYQSHHAAQMAGTVPAPAPLLSPKQAGATGLILALLVPLLLVGCQNNKDIAHVWTASQDGTTVGVTENPTTQLYELGVKRVHSHVTMIPIIFETNNVGNIRAVIPDVVVSDEINARSGIFGGAGGTITVATGTNAVGTLLGGGHVPINEGTGTNLPK